MQGPDEYADTGNETTINSQTIATETVIKEYLEPRFQEVVESGQENKFLDTPTIRSVEAEDDQEEQVTALSIDEPRRRPPEPPVNATDKAPLLHGTRSSLPSQADRDQAGNCNRAGRETSYGDSNVPSNEQRANRLGRSQNRWQATLEERSSHLSRAARYLVNDDNPYDLRPLSATPPDAYLPVAIRHARHAAAPQDSEPPRAVCTTVMQRNNVISPSVYSRASEYGSVTPDSERQKCGTVITVTGREIKRYPLDSPSKSMDSQDYIVKPSLEWKTWLNTEIGNLSTTSGLGEIVLVGSDQTRDILSDTSEDPYGFMEPQNRVVALACAGTNQAHGPVIRAPKTRRPAPDARRSSIMNDRYPLIDTKRDESTDRSVKGRFKPRTSSRQSSSTSEMLKLNKDAMVASSCQNPATLPKSVRPRIRERHSVATLKSTRQQTSLLNPDVQNIPNNERRSTNYKPKSAFDLRAVYRNTHKGGNNSIDIRRKPVSVLLPEDPTLRKISRGPYAQSSIWSKENAAPSSGSWMTSPGKPVKGNGHSYDLSWSPKAPPDSGEDNKQREESPGQKLADEFLNSRKGVAGLYSNASDKYSAAAFI